jgi:[acyl-carrier-protein] S-malonyltransferase
VSFAVLFPGQGSQFPGMGADLFAERPDLLGHRADYILGWSLAEVCLRGSEETLTRTEHAQPALFAISYALWEEVRARLLELPAAAAGHSLGEYTALAASGVIDFDDALAVVAERGQAMADAADLEPSGMSALLGASLEQAEDVSARRRAEGGRLSVANVNAPGQVVLAGGNEDLEWLEAEGPALGLRKVVRLKVAGAFHSPFMEPAAARVGRALAEVPFHSQTFPVWSNVTALPLPPGDERPALVDQVVSPVLFAQSLAGMADSGVELFVHIGPGDLTASMARRSAPQARSVAISDLAGIVPGLEAVGTIASPQPGP